MAGGRTRSPLKIVACFVIGGRTILYFDSSKALPDWKALSVDLVIDCTGRATTRSDAQAHLAAGAKRVIEIG
jgi:glyceraldehyde 3-phosphate dehydrogenase